jgi:hypothetical protein
MSDSMLRTALAVSAALHGLFGLWVEVRGHARAPVWREIADSWTGPGIEIDAVSAAPPDVAETRAPASGSDALHDATGEATSGGKRDDAEVTRATKPERELKSEREAKPEGETKRTHDAAPTRDRDRAPHVATKRQTTSPDSAASGSVATASGSVATASGSVATANGAFGAQGLPLGVRHLPKAFTRALSIADRGDPRWLTLPPGPAGEARVEIPVDDDGKLGALAYSDEAERDRLAPVVRHLLENTRLLLESGHFSLDPSMLRAGLQRLRVRVEVVERVAASDPDADPNELKELEYEAPTPTKPGRGSFALNSGRRVIGWVYVE